MRGSTFSPLGRLLRPHTTPRLASAIAVALSVASCSVGGTPEEFDRARALWLRSAPPDYQITLKHDCFCMREDVGPVIVTVHQGAVVGRQYTETGAAVAPLHAGVFPGVDSLFLILEDAYARHAARVDAQYDATLGYPTHFFIDYHANTLDEEEGYRVLAFQVLMVQPPTRP